MSDMPTAQDQQVLITRIFDAPRDLVFQAWTDPDQVAQWYGPDGFDTPRETVTIDLRVGGRYELRMVQKDSGAVFPVEQPQHRPAGWATIPARNRLAASRHLAS